MPNGATTAEARGKVKNATRVEPRGKVKNGKNHKRCRHQTDSFRRAFATYRGRGEYADFSVRDFRISRRNELPRAPLYPPQHHSQPCPASSNPSLPPHRPPPPPALPPPPA